MQTDINKSTWHKLGFVLKITDLWFGIEGYGMVKDFFFHKN